LDQNWYTDGGNVVITVTDASEDVTASASTSITFDGTDASNPQFFTLPGPLGDTNEDGVIDSNDFAVFTTGTVTTDRSILDFTVIVADVPGGGVNVVGKPGGTIANINNVLIDIVHDREIVSTLATSTTITSSSDPSGITIGVSEATADSGGAFKFTVTLISTGVSSSTLGTLLVANGDTITATFVESGDTASAVVETTVPEISIKTLTDGTKTFEQQPEFKVEFTDTQSQVDPSSIRFSIIGNNYNNTDTVPVNQSGEVTPSVSSSGNITTATFKPIFALDPGSPENTIQWSAKVSDFAGNATTTATTTITIDRVGATIFSSITGDWWDTSIAPFSTSSAVKDLTNKAGRDNGTDLLNSFLHTDDPNSVAVTFNEALRVSSINTDGSQFEVDGREPASAFISADLASVVFLTMLGALDPDATPAVEIVEPITDSAGNTTPVDTDTAADGIAPALTVTLDKSLINDADGVSATLFISANEPLQGNQPTVTMTTPGGGADGVSISVTLGDDDNTWEATIDVGDESLADGDQAIKVIGSDGTNNATFGGTDPAASSYPDGLALEVDTVLAGPTFSPIDGSTDSNASPFVQIQYAEAVTLTEATFASGDGAAEDVLAALIASSADSKLYVLSPGSFPGGATTLTLDDHEIDVTAVDAAGNEVEADATFTVDERDEFSLPLIAGWNLVSLPGVPADQSINAVISGSDVNTVIAYDASSGTFQTSVRDAVSGQLTGSLTQLDGTQGLWVNTTSFDPIEVAIPAIPAASLPPTIAVTAGWNLIGVIDVSGALVAANTLTSANTYLTGVDFSKIYRYNELTGAFVEVLGTDQVIIGDGLWLFATDAGTITP
jgi:hypothetical protein